MNIERVREICLQHRCVEECTPFGDDNLVFKVGGKMFALMSLDTNHWLNLKCNPERAIELREQYPDAITPGYHMNKKHWNTLYVDILQENLVAELISHAYELVYNSLPKKIKEVLL